MVNKINQYIEDANNQHPLIDLGIVSRIVKHQDACIVDGMMRLETTIKIDKLGKFVIKPKRKQHLINKFGNGDEQSFEDRKQEGLFINK